MKEYLEREIQDRDERLVRMQDNIEDLTAKLENVMRSALIVKTERDTYQRILDHLLKPT
jgi:archaellum component FlaC